MYNGHVIYTPAGVSPQRGRFSAVFFCQKPHSIYAVHFPTCHHLDPNRLPFLLFLERIIFSLEISWKFMRKFTDCRFVLFDIVPIVLIIVFYKLWNFSEISWKFYEWVTSPPRVVHCPSPILYCNNALLFFSAIFSVYFVHLQRRKLTEILQNIHVYVRIRFWWRQVQNWRCRIWHLYISQWYRTHRYRFWWCHQLAIYNDLSLKIAYHRRHYRLARGRVWDFYRSL